MPNIQPFHLERYFALYEFNTRYLLSPSDCESLKMADLLALADPQTRQLWADLSLGYTESPGHPLLRAEAAGLYEAIEPEGVVVAAPEEAVFIAMQTLLQPGDEVVSIFPAYQSLYEIARSIGCEVAFWSLQPDGQSGAPAWRFDLQTLERLITPRTRLLVVNFPHNPTGFLPDRAGLEAIVTLARRHNLYLFSDEMYRLLEYDPARRLPAVCDLYEKGISLGGLSKSLALPGLRIGWLATQDSELPGRWLGFKDYTTICSSAPSEVLAILALRQREAILARNRGIIQANLEIAERFFQKWAGQFEWLPPQAGSIAFPRWQGTGSVEDFCQRVLDEAGVMIVPGSLFGYAGNHFRLGLGRKNFGEALGKVEEVLLRL